VICVEDLVDRVRQLPPLPGTVVKLISVINDPRSTIDDIVEAIKYDQAVTGEVLRICNSAHFGLVRRVTSLDEATLCLGAMKVLQMVMAVHTNGMLSQAQTGYGLEPGMLWKHGVAVALASSAIAQRTRLPSASLAFTGGLLHDIGKVILNTFVGEAFAEIVGRVTEENLSFVEAERAVLGVSHEEIGGRVAEKWDLPEPIIRCIRHHHEPGELDPPDPLVDTVHLANCICVLFGVGLGDDGLSARADAVAMERHGLHESDLEIVGAQTLMELKRVEKIFADAPSAETAGVPAGK